MSERKFWAVPLRCGRQIRCRYRARSETKTQKSAGIRHASKTRLMSRCEHFTILYAWVLTSAQNAHQSISLYINTLLLLAFFTVNFFASPIAFSVLFR